MGLSDRLDHHPSELSGGQQQRVAIARALIMSPDLILADEATGNLDSATGEAVVGILNKLHEQGRTVILVTHDPAMAALAPRCVTITDGQISKDVVRGDRPNLAARIIDSIIPGGDGAANQTDLPLNSLLSKRYVPNRKERLA
jgi:putative ABC transport system ATP-binding protein